MTTYNTPAEKYGTWLNKAVTHLDVFRKRSHELEQVELPNALPGTATNAKVQAREAMKLEYRQMFRELETELTKSIQEYEAAYEASFRLNPKDTTQELLFEVKGERAWRNMRALLEYADMNGEPYDTVLTREVRAAAKRGDMVTFNTILEEMPTYLVTKQGYNPAKATEDVRHLVMGAAEEHLSKEQASAKYNLTTAKQYHNRALVGVRQAMHALDAQLTDEVTIPSIEPGKLLTLNPVAAQFDDRQAAQRELAKMGYGGMTFSDEEPK